MSSEKNRDQTEILNNLNLLFSLIGLLIIMNAIFSILGTPSDELYGDFKEIKYLSSYIEILIGLIFLYPLLDVNKVDDSGIKGKILLYHAIKSKLRYKDEAHEENILPLIRQLKYTFLFITFLFIIDVIINFILIILVEGELNG